ncbi:Hypothetical_protein [Hexamita inflata]|uniref:Hypothetical_protein n=1 Tax=Hexamita inflata TaxID=28002 RepID=A0ABP1H2F5_9EUKA
MRLGQIGCGRQNPRVQSAELPSRIGMAKGMPSTSLQDWKAVTAPLLPQKRRWYDAGGFPYRSACVTKFSALQYFGLEQSGNIKILQYKFFLSVGKIPSFKVSQTIFPHSDIRWRPWIFPSIQILFIQKNHSFAFVFYLQI